MTIFEISPRWQELLKGQGLVTFEALWEAPTKPFKSKKDREIALLELGDERFFLKRYFRFPLFGFLKSGAEREWWAAKELSVHGFHVPEPVAFGLERGLRRHRALSLFREVPGKRLEDLFKESPELFRKLLPPLVETAARFHALGFSHQDFYLCHLFWDGKRLFMIDLQRVRRARKIKPYWVIKDLAELFYSARQILGPGTREFEKAFLEAYFHYHPWLSEEKRLIKLEKKIAKIAAHDAKLKARRKDASL